MGRVGSKIKIFSFINSFAVRTALMKKLLSDCCLVSLNANGFVIAERLEFMDLINSNSTVILTFLCQIFHNKMT